MTGSDLSSGMHVINPTALIKLLSTSLKPAA